MSEHIKPEPQDLIDAQYSLPFQIAGHLTGRAARFDWLLDTSFDSPDLIAVGKRVTFEQDEGHEQLFQRARTAASTVTLRLTRAERMKTIEYAWGSPQRPITDADLERKFVDFVGPVLGEQEARSVVALLWDLEAVDNVHDALQQRLGLWALA